MKKKQIKNVFFIVGNSGSGKNKVYENMLKKLPLSLKMMISYTTRGIRDKEIPDVDYYFIKKDLFDTLKPDFMECIDFGNKAYGYHKLEVLNNINSYNHLLFIIEPNGIEQILQWFKNSFDGKKLLEQYEINFKILHIKTKKSIRLKRLLSNVLSQHDSYGKDFIKTDDIINRLQREGDSIDELLSTFLSKYKSIFSNVDYLEINNNGTEIDLREKFLKEIIKDCGEIDYKNK